MLPSLARFLTPCAPTHNALYCTALHCTALHCTVCRHLPLPAVHFVGIEDTEIIFYNKRKDGNCHAKETKAANNNNNDCSNANTTIHMTDCRGRSLLELETSAQQLRIHRSIGLRVKLMDGSVNTTTTMPSCNWKPGTIILEASRGIVFSVPPLVEAAPANPRQQEREQEALSLKTVATTKTYWHQVIVKDFQWLRKGIASPNFKIEVLVVTNDNDENNKNSTAYSTDIVEVTRNTVLHRDSNAEELESGNDSDSEDEL